MNAQDEIQLLHKIIEKLSEKIDKSEFKELTKNVVKTVAVENYNNKLRNPNCNLTITRIVKC